MLCEPKLIQLSTDILVIGGGLPGVCAAIQAAQAGADVILVERGRTLGGNCGPELGVHPSDAHRFHPYMVSVGTVGKLIEDAAFESAKTSTAWFHYNISQRWDTIMIQALEKAGVHVLRCHYAHSPEVEDEKITAVICEDTAAYERVRIEVRGSVIDASGDGNVSDLAGATWRMGREAKSEYNERIAPEIADSLTMGSSVVVLVHKTDHEVKFVPPEGTPPFKPGYGGMLNFNPGSSESLQFFFPCETGGDINTIKDEHTIYDRLLKMIYSAWNRIKNDIAVETAKNWDILWMSPRIGKRESRRFMGDYVLNLNDVETGRCFDDAIAAGGFAVDIHYPRPDTPEYVKIVYYSTPPVYTIPYRSIYSRDVKNLFFASRLLSVTHLAHGTVRLQRTLATIGQAAGMAAAMCFEKNIMPRELYQQGYVDELRQRLLRNDAAIPGAIKNDPADMTAFARIKASSEQKYGVGVPTCFVLLDRIRGCELWDFETKINRVSFHLRNASSKPCCLRAKLLRFAPERPYLLQGERKHFDYYSCRNEAEWGSDHKLEHFKEIGTAESLLPANFDGMLSFEFATDLSAKNMGNDDDRVMVLLEPCEGVELGMLDDFHEFVRSVEGIEDGSYIVRPRTCAYVLEPAPAYGEARQALNGWIRRFCTNPINMWRPLELPATATLCWDKAFDVGEVQLTFDTLERTAHEMPFECKKQASAQCVKAFTVCSFVGDIKTAAVCMEDNHNRMVRIHLGGAKCDRMTVELRKTWEAGRLPGLYDIRVYRTE
ncbi:MAG: FAD-dependent oxidoreductase [Christensenellales bacterium]|jgi:hypothetical protein